MLTLNDLRPWCFKDETRHNIQKPFVRDGKTYATNGLVMIELDAILEGADGEGVDAGHVLGKAFFGDLHPVSLNIVEPKHDGECPECRGTGRAHPNCPECGCECDECDGSGEAIIPVYVALRGGYFNSKYTNLLARLPSLQMPKECPSDETIPIGFTFDGGRGAIMRVRASGIAIEGAVPVEMERAGA